MFAGGYGEEVPPDSIPNSEVKLPSADGTAREPVWESRTSPALKFMAPVGFSSGRGFFYARKRRIYIELVVAGLKLVYSILIYHSYSAMFEPVFSIVR